MESNYEKQVYMGREYFLKYDQEKLAVKFHLEMDERYLYLTYIGTPCRIERATGTVYEKNGSGQEKPYVSETMEPEVSGVLVVSEGGDDPVTVREITEAVQALFGIEAHKIKVMKMD